MQETIASPSLTDLQAAILRTIVYSDLFDFPLTPAEVRCWLPVAASRGEVEAAIGEAPLSSVVSSALPYVTLKGRQSIVELRERRAGSSATLQHRAGRYGRLIARLPFVRMVGLTGSLAVDNADDGDDIDFLIVTAPGRVWMTRTMVMAIGRLAALRGLTLCPNYLIAETALALPDRDTYTARELLQMRAIAGTAMYARMLDANPWVSDFLPNAGAPHPPTPSPKSERGGLASRVRDADSAELSGAASGSNERLAKGKNVSPSPKSERGPGGEVSLTRRAVEALLRLPPFDAIERWILARKGAELRRQASGPEAVFDETMCKGHFDAWKERTRRRLEERMQELYREVQDSSCSLKRDSTYAGPEEPSP